MASILVIVSYKVFPADMGGQKGIVLFYEYLKAHHTIAMAVSADNGIESRSYPINRFLYANNQIWWNVCHIRMLSRLVNVYKADCIIAEHSYTGWIAFLLKKVTGKPFIIHSHNIESSRFRQMGKRGWKLYDRYEKWIHRQADFNFFKTEEEKNTALERYALDSRKCGVIPYGIESVIRIPDAKSRIRSAYGVSSRYIFYFNGTLDYAPNRQAVEVLVTEIDPLLRQKEIDFTILISGKRLEPLLQSKIARSNTIRYLGFVEDINSLYQAADLFLNPVLNDSGVRTKMVEAIANYCTVVSTESGAAGIPKYLCPGKINTAKDGDWQEFTNTITKSLVQHQAETPSTFFTYFAWQQIAEKAAGFINATISYA